MTQHALDIASPAAPSATAPSATPVDARLLERVLQPYRGQDCAYLRQAGVVPGDGRPRAVGEFSIPQPCYIDDTGHLNAAEVIICYNQLLYALLAVSIRDRLVPALGDWTEADYWRHQLAGVLITRQTTTFTRPIDPRDFHGELSFDQALTGRRSGRSQPLVTLRTAFGFGDRSGGACHGQVRVAVVRS
jgi:hypothetical protein